MLERQKVRAGQNIPINMEESHQRQTRESFLSYSSQGLYELRSELECSDTLMWVKRLNNCSRIVS